MSRKQEKTTLHIKYYRMTAKVLIRNKFMRLEKLLTHIKKAGRKNIKS